MSLHKKYQSSSCVFSQNTTFQKSSCVLTKHLNPSNYKPVYTTYLCIFTQKIPKFLLCFFTKHYISKILMCSHKTLFSQTSCHLCVFTQKYQSFSCVFSQNTTFQKSSCVLTKTLKSE